MSGSERNSSIKILQITDTHLHATVDSRMRGVNTFTTFMAVLEHARRSPRWPADAILVTGDIVQDESRAGYEQFRARLQGLGPRVLCIPGNHDDPKLMDEVLSAAPFQVGGAIRLGPWSLVLLDTFLTGEDAGGLGDRRLLALAATLNEHISQHVVVCMHHQPLPMGSAWLDGVGLRDAAQFLRVIDAHDNVRCVVWGHVHQASDRMRGRVRYLSTPSTGSQFLPSSDFFALDNRPAGMRWIELHSDATIDTAVDWVDAPAAR